MKEKREIARRELQKKREKIREQTRERVRKYRERKQQDTTQEKEQATEAASTSSRGDAFQNRMSKKRITDRVKKTLPSSPKKKATKDSLKV